VLGLSLPNQKEPEVNHVKPRTEHKDTANGVRWDLAGDRDRDRDTWKILQRSPERSHLDSCNALVAA